MTDFVTVTEVSTMVEPTTFTSIWVSTEIKDNVSPHALGICEAMLRRISFQTKTVLNTVTSTVVQDKTYLQTLTYVSTATVSETATATQTVVETALSDCLGRVIQFSRFLCNTP